MHKYMHTHIHSYIKTHLLDLRITLGSELLFELNTYIRKYIHISYTNISSHLECMKNTYRCMHVTYVFNHNARMYTCIHVHTSIFCAQFWFFSFIVRTIYALFTYTHTYWTSRSTRCSSECIHTFVRTCMLYTHMYISPFV